jgi:hypothetical protein
MHPSDLRLLKFELGAVKAGKWPKIKARRNIAA